MIRRTTALLLCLLLCVFCLLPAGGSADAETKIIRVGWYETPFNYRDSAGRRTGYAYEYQRTIAAYTGQCHLDKDNGKRTGTEISLIVSLLCLFAQCHYLNDIARRRQQFSSGIHTRIRTGVRRRPSG